jgi:hypothetical protein
MLARPKISVAMSLLSISGILFVAMPFGPARGATVLAASPEQQIRLSSTPTRVIIASAKPALERQTRELAEGQHILLVVEGLSAALVPGASYDVYLGPEGGPHPPSRDDPGYAGTLNFYNISASTPETGRAVSFDVTSVLARLLKSGDINRPLAVTFVPDAPPQANSEPAVQRLKLITP